LKLVATASLEYLHQNEGLQLDEAKKAFFQRNHGNEILELLLPDCLSDHLYTRHGSMVATANILYTMVLYTDESLSSANHSLLENLVPAVEKKRLYRGKGSELIREAVCQLIESIAKVKLNITSAKNLTAIFESINDHLKHPQATVQFKARDALRYLLFQYFAERRCTPIPPFPNTKILDLSLFKYLPTLTKGQEANVAVIRGYILALGVFPDRFLLLPTKNMTSATATEEPNGGGNEWSSSHSNYLEVLLDILDDYSNSTKLINGEYDAESCQYAIESVVELGERLLSSSLFQEKYLQRIFQILFKGANDYSTDKRGDTGSWTRIATMRGIERLFAAIFANLSAVHAYGSGSKLILTPLGIGVVRCCLTDDLPTSTKEGAAAIKKSSKLVVEYPAQSLGSIASAEEKWLELPASVTQQAIQSTEDRMTAGLNCLPILSESNILQKLSGTEDNASANYETISIQLATYLSLLSTSTIVEGSIGIFLKQMAEKLDSLRNFAGSILYRILFFRFQHYSLLPRSSSGVIGSIADLSADVRLALEEKGLLLTIPDEDRIWESIEITVKEINASFSSAVNFTGESQAHSSANSTAELEQEAAEPAPSDAIATGEDEVTALNGDEDAQVDDAGDEEVVDVVAAQTYLVSVINWHRPDHVYPVLTRLLRVRRYFSAIFSGLVTSIGGLTETIVKHSRKNFLAISYEVVQGGNRDNTSTAMLTKDGYFDTLIASVEGMVRDFASTGTSTASSSSVVAAVATPANTAQTTKGDRVMIPLLKNLILIFRENLFNKYIASLLPAAQDTNDFLVIQTLSTQEEKLLAFYEHLGNESIAAEIKNTTSIPKLFLLIDLLVLLFTQNISLRPIYLDLFTSLADSTGTSRRLC
jgi:hypothetical protein